MTKQEERKKHDSRCPAADQAICPGWQLVCGVERSNEAAKAGGIFCPTTNEECRFSLCDG